MVTNIALSATHRVAQDLIAQGGVCIKQGCGLVKLHAELKSVFPVLFRIEHGAVLHKSSTV